MKGLMRKRFVPSSYYRDQQPRKSHYEDPYIDEHKRWIKEEARRRRLRREAREREEMHEREARLKESDRAMQEGWLEIKKRRTRII